MKQGKENFDPSVEGSNATSRGGKKHITEKPSALFKHHKKDESRRH